MSKPTEESQALTFPAVREMAEYLSESRIIPEALRKRPADVCITILAGQELGIGPMASLRSIYVVDGRPVISAQAMVAIARNSGAMEWFRRTELTDERATYETLRRGTNTPQRETFTLEDARRAELLSRRGWVRHPRSMLCARAKSRLVRDVYPEALLGVYTPDEAEDFSTGHTQKVVDAVVVADPEPIPEEPTIAERVADAAVRDEEYRRVVAAWRAELATLAKEGAPPEIRRWYREKADKAKEMKMPQNISAELREPIRAALRDAQDRQDGAEIVNDAPL